ncbi:DUF6259 domain-containing protein [Victivallis sp. Marseille-Q1083]|uniref:DUF6259 domain-containing protein n=1 Tax=Victivallis sp. Marseille-Q1083 TaxID=2717288 RepID=UPI001589896E|nr:DUF6259 domain-containing protein [Victivallis sp. Marseille-Q1083]
MKKLLMLGLSLCCTTGLLAAVEFSTEKLKLEFAAPEAGMGLTGVTDLASGQKFFPAPAANAPLWQLEFAGGEPAAIRPHSHTAAVTLAVDNHTPAVCSSRETAIDGRRGLELVWDQIDLGPEKDALQVVCRIRETDDGEVEMTLHPTLKSKVHTFNSQFFPRFANALATPEDEVLFPRGTFGSRLVRSAEHGTYPSVESQLQFFGFYRDGAGLYLGIHDGGAACKYFKLDDDGSLQVQTYAENTLLPGQSRLPAFAVQLAGSPTPWHATRRYRQWALRQPWTRKGKLKERRDVPAAARNIALWVLIWGDPEAVAAGFQAEQQHQEGTLALHWYLWNRYPFDHHYPEYFPVKDRFTDTVEQLQQDGDIVMPYINGRLWDTTLPSYAATGRREVTVQADGTPREEDYNSGIRLGAVCPTQPNFRRLIRETFATLVEQHKVKAVYLDQIAASAPVLCFNPEHGHPLGGGTWWVEAYREMLEPLVAAYGADTLITSECAAEPYLDVISGYLTWFPAYSNDFPSLMGTYQQYAIYFCSPVTAEDPLPTFRAAVSRCLLWNIQPGWLGWLHGNPATVDDNPERRGYLSRVIAWRRAAADFILDGELLDAVTFTPASPELELAFQTPGYLSSLPPDKVGKHPAYYGTLWRSENGQRLAAAIANVADQDYRTTFRFNAEAYEVMPEGKNVYELNQDGSKRLLGPAAAPVELELPGGCLKVFVLE